MKKLITVLALTALMASCKDETKEKLEDAGAAVIEDVKQNADTAAGKVKAEFDTLKDKANARLDTAKVKSAERMEAAAQKLKESAKK